MASIKKLSIRGIRSFSHERDQVIEFYTPLTMIVGANGCGKTTIIECLKYACTGALPPGARNGQSFVHDPKVSGTNEVKANIKLRFCTRDQTVSVVIRAFQLTQKRKTLQFKALDGVIRTKGENGQSVSINHKCTEMDKHRTARVPPAADMLQALGRRASRHGYRYLASPAAPRCASYEAMVHRCLASAAGSTGTWKADPVASPGKVDPAAVGTTAATAEEGSSSVEMDKGGDPNHILLYTGSKRNIRISSSVTVVNAFYWSFYVGVLEPHLPDTTWEPWGYIGIGFTAIMAATSHIFAKHWVSQISYLPDLKLLSIGTHTFFGGERMPRLVRLGGTIVPPSKDTAIYFTFKVRGDYFNSLLDSEDGVFHDREMLMRLLKASPNGVVPEPSAAESDGSEGAKAKKPTLKWKRRKRGR